MLKNFRAILNENGQKQNKYCIIPRFLCEKTKKLKIPKKVKNFLSKYLHWIILYSIIFLAIVPHGEPNALKKQGIWTFAHVYAYAYAYRGAVAGL